MMHPSCTMPRKFSALYSYLTTNLLKLESHAKSLSIFQRLLYRLSLRPSCVYESEMAGWIDFHVGIIKDGMNKYGVRNAVIQLSPIEPRYSDFLLFEGISVDREGTQYYMDAHVAYQDTCLKAIEYLGKFGYTEEQAYVLLSVAPIEGRVSAIVDIPSACCTVGIPTEIFDFDIKNRRLPGRFRKTEDSSRCRQGKTHLVSARREDTFVLPLGRQGEQRLFSKSRLQR